MAEYEPRLVAFLDVLGWKNFVDRSVADPNLIDNMLSALKHVPPNDAYGSPKYGTDDIGFTPPLTQFSDSIVLTCPLTIDQFTLAHVYQFFSYVRGIALLMLASGFPVRGGVTDGLIYHQGVHVFGPALNVAVELEKTSAVYPRVVMQKTADGKAFSNEARHIIEECRKVPHTVSYLSTYAQPDMLNRFLARADDGMQFIDYLPGDYAHQEATLRKVLVTIRRGLETYKNDVAIFPKYDWLDQYSRVKLHTDSRLAEFFAT